MCTRSKTARKAKNVEAKPKKKMKTNHPQEQEQKKKKNNEHAVGTWLFDDVGQDGVLEIGHGVFYASFENDDAGCIDFMLHNSPDDDELIYTSNRFEWNGVDDCRMHKKYTVELKLTFQPGRLPIFDEIHGVLECKHNSRRDVCDPIEFYAVRKPDDNDNKNDEDDSDGSFRYNDDDDDSDDEDFDDDF